MSSHELIVLTLAQDSIAIIPLTDYNSYANVVVATASSIKILILHSTDTPSVSP